MIKNINRIAWRLLEKIFQLLDGVGVFFVYDQLSYWLKPNARKLTTQEIAIAKTVFGAAIDYKKVKIDERAYLGPRQYHLCYVSFNTINSWGAMPSDILIHELVHVWQYQQVGAVYIPRALWAQRTSMGYNYGGVAALRLAQQQSKTFMDFNYEQQGDIVADYFRICNGYPPRWGQATLAEVEVYLFFVKQLRAFRGKGK